MEHLLLNILYISEQYLFSVFIYQLSILNQAIILPNMFSKTTSPVALHLFLYSNKQTIFTCNLIGSNAQEDDGLFRLDIQALQIAWQELQRAHIFSASLCIHIRFLCVHWYCLLLYKYITFHGTNDCVFIKPLSHIPQSKYIEQMLLSVPLKAVKHQTIRLAAPMNYADSRSLVVKERSFYLHSKLNFIVFQL